MSAPTPLPMGSTQQIGQTGEDIARHYLEDHGYTFIAANWRCKAGEIDLLMWAPTKQSRIMASLLGSFGWNSGSLGSRSSKTLAVIEVRTRSATTYGRGEDTVAHQKQRKIIRATQWYQQTVDFWGDVQFDVVAIEQTGVGEPTITHIPHAFTVQ